MSKLPTLAELHHDITAADKNDKLNLLLNQDPPAKWVKRNPYAGNTAYLPIDKIELLLTRIFQHWKIEVLREGQMFNSVYVTVRLHYKNPLTNEWMYHDGTGAVGVQTDAGKSASDLGAIKQNAIMMALPAAKSYAVKDAAENIGRLFGSNLNRRDTVAFSGSYVDQEKKRALDWLQQTPPPTPEQIKAFWNMPTNERFKQDADFADFLI